MKNRIISVLAIAYLTVVAVLTTVLSAIESFWTWAADTVSDHGFRVHDYVTHLLGQCDFCNALDQFGKALDAKIEADRQQQLTKPVTTSGPQKDPSTPPSGKPQIIVANPQKFVS